MTLRVLLIDDDAVASGGIELMLRVEGMVCEAVGSGAEGVERGRRHPYDVILLDLMLPDMTGFEVLHALRAAQIGTPVIILSGLGELDNRVTGLDSGADDYIIKPVERRELIARIRALVRRSMGQLSGTGPGGEVPQLLARKGGASPWSFSMSYVAPGSLEPANAPAVEPRAAGTVVALPPAARATPASRPRRDADAPGYIVVLGNEKGGSGKSTTAMHVIGGLLAAGRRVACIDLDVRQRTLSRYLDNRRATAAARDIALPMPELVATDLADDDAGGLDAVLAATVGTVDYVVVDTPGSATKLSRAAHAWADTVITPLNDSFVDLDVLGRIDDESAEVVETGPYAELIDAARSDKLSFSSRPLDWVVLRNRLAPRDTRNTHRMTTALQSLSRRLGFRGAPGLTDRLIFRELFLAGLTLLDLPKAGGRFTMSHVAARQELRAMIDGIGLEKRKAAPDRMQKHVRLSRRR